MITPAPGWMVDPNNPNGVIPIGSAATVNNANANIIAPGSAPYQATGTPSNNAPLTAPTAPGVPSAAPVAQTTPTVGTYTPGQAPSVNAPVFNNPTYNAWETSDGTTYYQPTGGGAWTTTPPSQGGVIASKTIGGMPPGISPAPAQKTQTQQPQQPQTQQPQQTAPAQAPAAPATTSLANANATAPTMALQPGMTGDSVKQLQDFLVSQGYMTQEQVNTGYGTYGPQTTAAVAKLQQSLGIDNSSGEGFFGPKTIAALSQNGQHEAISASDSGITTNPTTSTSQPTSSSATDKFAGLDPVAKQIAMYTEAYTSLGLPTIKQQYDDFSKQLSDLQNELDDKKVANQNNPWLAQGIVDKMNANLDARYSNRLKTLTNLLTLTDSLYKQGTAQADTIVSNAQADIKATNDLAQKQIDAANAIAKDNVIQSIGGREVLVNKETGQKIADLGPTTQSSTTSGANNVIQSIGGREILIDKRTGAKIADLGPTTHFSSNSLDNLFPPTDGGSQSSPSSSSTNSTPVSLYDQVGQLDLSSLGL